MSDISANRFDIADVPGFRDVARRYTEDLAIDPATTTANGTNFERQPGTPAMQGGNASRDLVRDMLSRYGLEGLVDVVMGFWTDEMNEAQIMQRLRDTDQFKTRFPAIAGREAAGLNAMSPEEILNYEQTVRDIFSRAGIPETFYDTPAELQALAINDYSPTEVQERVFDGYAAIASNPAIRDAFGSYFADGVSTDGALVAWMLDPERAVPAIERAVNAARFGGTGSQYGFDLGREFSIDTGADRLGGLSDQALRSGFADAATRAGLATETLGERGTDLNQESVVGATFETDVDAMQDIRRRMQSRTGQGAGGGGFAESRRGVVGLR